MDDTGASTPEGPKPSFDIASMATATKIVLIAGILLLVVSFLSWQKVCFDTGVIGDVCGKASAWGGDGSFAGLLMGLLLIALLVFEVVRLTNANISGSLPVASSKLAAYLGFAVVGFGVLKFLLIVSNHAAFGAWIGLVLLAVVGYGSWLHFKEPEA